MTGDRRDSLLGWLERSIERLENTSTDERVRLALEECLTDIAHGPGPEYIKRLVGVHLHCAVGVVTHRELHEKWLPSMRQERGRPAARAAGAGPWPGAPPAAGGPAAKPRNVPDRSGCFGGTAILLLKALLRLP